MTERERPYSKWLSDVQNLPLNECTWGEKRMWDETKKKKASRNPSERVRVLSSTVCEALLLFSVRLVNMCKHVHPNDGFSHAHQSSPQTCWECISTALNQL